MATLSKVPNIVLPIFGVFFLIFFVCLSYFESSSTDSDSGFVA